MVAIGDVTTIMLWIGGQVTSANIIAKLFLPSVVHFGAADAVFLLPSRVPSSGRNDATRDQAVASLLRQASNGVFHP